MAFERFDGPARALVRCGFVASLSLAAAGNALAGDSVMQNRMLVAQASKGQPAASKGAISPAAAQAEHDALLKAAKAEGEVVWYCALTENICKRSADGFTAKYGIKSSFVRIIGNLLFTRFASEAEVGNFPTDMTIVSGTLSTRFAEDGIRKGWVESVATAGLPVMRSGQFPASAMRGPVALVNLAPWGIGFNTDKIKGADVPKDWTEILHPKYKGQILMPDPRSADAYIEFYAVLLEKYGEQWFDKLRAQSPRFFIGGVPAIQALSAGEGSFQVPVVTALVQGPKDKGAPLNMAVPAYTTGVENYVMLTHRAKVKHPNAARLFVNYLMSPDGNKVLNDDPGAMTVYDVSGLPKQYKAPHVSAHERKELLVKLVGGPTN